MPRVFAFDITYSSAVLAAPNCDPARINTVTGTGNIALTWFNQPWIKRQLEGYKGEIIAYGQVKDNRLLEIEAAERFSLRS